MLDNMLESTGFNALVKAKDGYLLYNKNDVYIGRSIEKYGEFSGLETDTFQHLCHPANVVVEVGSNIGAHTLMLAKRVGESGRVYAIEAQRVLHQTLCANIALNSITNTECIHAAAGSSNGQLQIPDIDYSKEGNFGGIAVDRFQSGIPVPLIKLDDRLEYIQRLDFFKLDVEGMEKEVLLGAKKLVSRFRPTIYLENDRIEKSQALISLLQGMGYMLYWHLPKLYNPGNFAQDKENIFGQIASINMLCFHQDNKVQVNGLTQITDPEYHPMKKE